MANHTEGGHRSGSLRIPAKVTERQESVGVARTQWTYGSLHLVSGLGQKSFGVFWNAFGYTARQISRFRVKSFGSFGGASEIGRILDIRPQNVLKSFGFRHNPGQMF